MKNVEMQITIPSDGEGFVLLQCPLCTDYFKLRPSDMEDEVFLQIYCPSCGQAEDSFFTDDILDLARIKALNHVRDELHNMFKKVERKSKKSIVSLKAGKKPKHEYESPIGVIADTLTRHKYECCKREAKIKPIMKIAGTYCPFCGVKNFEINEG